MAKQRRSPARPATPKPRRGRPAAPPPEAQPARTPGYPEAVGLYERGLKSLQEHDFGAATDVFRQILDRYPDERELHERVRLYLKVCARELDAVEATPRTVEERVYAATLALNAADYGQARAHLGTALEQDHENDHAEYMLAVVLTQSGDLDAALTHLRRAVELNPDNRTLARRDADLDALKTTDGFRAVVDSFAAGAGRRRARRSLPRSN